MCNDRDNLMQKEKEIYILTVIPIGKSVPRGELHYFSGLSPLIGSLISVPLKNKNSPAVVIGSQNAKEIKTDLKNFSYEVKKILNPSQECAFENSFVEVARQTSRYYLAPVGQILNYFFKPTREINPPRSSQMKKEEKMVLQAPEEERLALYKSLIREEFAKKSSLFFCLPTYAQIGKFALALKKGIEEYVYALSGDLGNKEIKAVLKKMRECDHPLLLLATPHFLSLIKKNFGTLVIENEASPYYKTRERPFFDLAHFGEMLAKETGLKLILADSLLSVKTLYLKDKGAYLPIAPLKFRLPKENTTQVIDMRGSKGNQAENILGQELTDLVEAALNHNEKIFLFVLRKGVAPITICGDCGRELTCKDCQSPLVLYHPPSYLCHKCLKRYPADVRCPHCRSWRLNPLGIGIERVEELLRKKFPSASIFKIESSSGKTNKKIEEITRKFLTTPSAILIGTELGLNHLDVKVTHSAVVSLDGLFALPDYSMPEKVLALLLRLSNKTEKYFLIQTRNPEERIFQYLTRGNLLDFYRNELETREKFGYPPIKLLIKISLTAKKEEVEKETADIAKMLADWKPEVYSAFTPKVKGLSLIHI